MANASGLADEQLRALARLSAVPMLAGHYLAGGTAVAVHLHHRVSRDLDLFGFTDTPAPSALQRALIVALPDLEVLAISDAALQIRLESIPIDIVRYPHALLEPTTRGPGGIAVASRVDLATMKLAALAGRGARRDFWDLHELLTAGGLSLAAALDAYLRRFGKSEPDLYHVLRALTYFDDAEREPIPPAGLDDEHWQRVKAYFVEAAPEALRQRKR